VTGRFGKEKNFAKILSKNRQNSKNAPKFCQKIAKIQKVRQNFVKTLPKMEPYNFFT
jgi:hypothetical protein